MRSMPTPACHESPALLPCDKNRLTVTFTGERDEFVTFRFTFGADERQLLLAQYTMCHDEQSPANAADLFSLL